LVAPRAVERRVCRGSGPALRDHIRRPLLSGGVQKSLQENIRQLVRAGAKRVTGDTVPDEPGYRSANTLLRVRGDQFLSHPEQFQIEAFATPHWWLSWTTSVSFVASRSALKGT